KKDYAGLLKAIESANAQMVGRAAAVVNQALVLRNWLIGTYLVEYEQGGSDRAKYGARLLEQLAKDLATRGVKGLGRSILERCRVFFLIYPQIVTAISETGSAELVPALPAGDSVTTGYGIRQPAVAESEPGTALLRILQPLVTEFETPQARKRIRGSVTPASHKTGISAPQVRKSAESLPTPLTPDTVLKFSWTKLLEFTRIEDPWKRAFYENECLKGNWSKRQLQRQIESLLYGRTGLSKNKQAVIQRARGQEPQETIADLIRDPYVLEFAGLAERPEYSENDLETALLDHLQRFLLELGTGFCFEVRQFRITVGRKHDRVDLVFYHRRLRCHVLVDLKIRAFRHTDAGQMNFYLNWFQANMMADGDNPPIGIILCSDRDGTEVEFATAGIDNQLFVSRYLVALPSADQLRKLLEADRALFTQEHPEINS
ncbi:MAG: DUF1016 family protein, partial [Planctomycetes bacterium]|nr:DUF1016 family protein [Planctomycetota bacterium]